MFLGTPRDEGHHQWQGTSAEWSLILEQNISVLEKCCALFSRLCFRSRLHHHSKLHNFKMHNTLKWIWLLWIENTELFLIYFAESMTAIFLYCSWFSLLTLAYRKNWMEKSSHPLSLRCPWSCFCKFLQMDHSTARSHCYSHLSMTSDF